MEKYRWSEEIFDDLRSNIIAALDLSREQNDEEVCRFIEKEVEEYSRKKVWKMIIGTYIWRIVLFSTIILAIILLSRLWFIPLLVEVLPDWGIHIACLLYTSPSPRD